MSGSRHLALAMAVLSIGLASSVLAQAPSSGDLIRIARIEHHLPPAVVVPGVETPGRTLAAAMTDAGVPGLSMAVIRNGRIAWTRQYGVARTDGEPVGPHTRFQAGSISKSITALGAMAAVGSGDLSLDEDVNARLKSWRLPIEDAAVGAPVTLAALLSHTAGVTVHGFPGYRQDETIPTLRQVLEGTPPSNTAAVRATTRPGEAWLYSGGGYEVIQQLVEDVTGAAFEVWMARQVFIPLGMTNSGYEQRVRLDDHAMAHDARGHVVEAGPYIYPEQAAAGLWTTPEDLAVALIAVQRALSGEKGEAAQALAQRMLAEVKPGRALGFDVGGETGGRWFSKSGDTEGFGAFAVAFESGDGAVVMANGANGASLAQDVVRSIASAYGWDAFQPRERSVTSLTPEQAARLEGRYRYGEWGEFRLQVMNGRLMLSSPGENPEPAYAASPDEVFGLSQDASFVFDPDSARAQGGHIQFGASRLPFSRID